MFVFVCCSSFVLINAYETLIIIFLYSPLVSFHLFLNQDQGGRTFHRLLVLTVEVEVVSVLIVVVRMGMVVVVQDRMGEDGMEAVVLVVVQLPMGMVEEDGTEA